MNFPTGLVPISHAFSKPWTFILNPEGYITLCAVLETGVLVPIFYFTAPESFKDFYIDTKLAYEEFIPKTVRDAISIVEAYKAEEKK